jgi:hypothetical protein
MVPMEPSLARQRLCGCGSETSPVVGPVIQVHRKTFAFFYFSRLDKDFNNEPFVSPK